MSVNKVILLGRLGADPEIRYTQSQLAICNLRIATNDRRKSADGEWSDHTEWHRVVTFGKNAENCNQYLEKGREVFVEGRIRTNKWQDQDGKDRYSTEIIADNVRFIGGRGGANVEVQRGASSGASPVASTESLPKMGQAVSFDDDDIPF